MTTRKISVLALSFLVGLAAFVSLCEAGGSRCLYTHRDPHCDVTGTIPLQLRCNFPGKWFTVKSVSKKTNEGSWVQVPKAKSVAETQCKASRTLQQGARGGSSCTVSGSLSEISSSDVVKVEYYCWEIDPDLLGGFGKRSRTQLHSKIFDLARDI